MPHQKSLGDCPLLTLPAAISFSPSGVNVQVLCIRSACRAGLAGQALDAVEIAVGDDTADVLGRTAGAAENHELRISRVGDDATEIVRPGDNGPIRPDKLPVLVPIKMPNELAALVSRGFGCQKHIRMSSS